MSNIRPPDMVLKKPVACWLTQADYDRLAVAASRYKVCLAVFIRSCIIDALADEDDLEEQKAAKAGVTNL